MHDAVHDPIVSYTRGVLGENTMKFYLAGKIGPNDWRHSIVLGLRDAVKPLVGGSCGHGSGYGILPDEWAILRGAVLGQHDYVGPFFMPSTATDGVDDVRLIAHGSNTHGNAISDLTESEWSGSAITNQGLQMIESSPSRESDYLAYELARKQVIKLCLQAIMKADVIFAWMDSYTAYGTLVELGFALAHHKPIWWGEAERPYDMLGVDLWFARSTAEMVAYAPDARAALDQLLTRKFRPQINGYVYILRSGDFIKIGKSKDVDQRVTQISPKTPMPVVLLHTIASDDMSWAEAALHRHYSHYRTNGEWFLLPQSELDWLLTIKHLSRSLVPDRLR